MHSMAEQWMCWEPIDTLPDTGKQVLVGFEGQFSWYSFVINAYGDKTDFGAHAKPTHWTEIIPPKIT